MDLSAWFSGDVVALNKSGDIALYVWLGRIAMAAGAICFLCVLASGWVNFSAKNKAHTMHLAELQGEGLTNQLWTANQKKLVELDFGQPTTVGDVRVFRREVPPKPPTDTDPTYPTTNVVVQRGGKTIALADVVRVHQEASWELASSERLIMDGEVVSLGRVFESPEFRRACEPLQGKGVSVIFIGLESYPTRDRQKGSDLSDKRATALGEACLRYTAQTMKYPEDTMFWAVGLGRAKTAVEADTPEEAQQRAAVVITVTRRQTRDEAISVPEVFGLLIQTTQVGGTVLADYSEAAHASERLRASKTDFAGFLPLEARRRPPGQIVH